MSSLAQEESRSISENCTWGQRKRFADGKVTVPFQRFLGYDRGPDGNLVVNPEQALIVKDIYSMFLQGMTCCSIAKKLTEKGILTPGGKKKWATTTVKSILTNEKYKGDALLQKSYTVDYLTKKKKMNEGEIPQYYVEDNHEAIIEPDIFELVQREMAERECKGGHYSAARTFSAKIRCGECGGWYGSKTWHSNSKYRRTVWRCNQKYEGEQVCHTPHLNDEDIERLFVKALNQLLAQRPELIANYEDIQQTLFDTSALEEEQEALLEDAQMISDSVNMCIQENAHYAQDQTEYQKRYDALVARFDATKKRLDEAEAAIQDKKTRRAKMKDFINDLKNQPEQISEFNPTLWYSLIDFAAVYSKDDIRFTFKNGTEITVKM